MQKQPSTSIKQECSKNTIQANEQLTLKCSIISLRSSLRFATFLPVPYMQTLTVDVTREFMRKFKVINKILNTFYKFYLENLAQVHIHLIHIHLKFQPIVQIQKPFLCL